jgi:hypothetical protein
MVDQVVLDGHGLKSVPLSLFLAQQEVHDPAAPDMRPRLSAVVEDLGVVAPGFFESFGQKRQALEGPFVVNRLGNGKDGGVVARQGDRAEGIADNLSYERRKSV